MRSILDMTKQIPAFGWGFMNFTEELDDVGIPLADIPADPVSLEVDDIVQKVVDQYREDQARIQDWLEMDRRVRYATVADWEVYKSWNCGGSSPPQSSSGLEDVEEAAALDDVSVLADPFDPAEGIAVKLPNVPGMRVAVETVESEVSSETSEESDTPSEPVAVADAPRTPVTPLGGATGRLRPRSKALGQATSWLNDVWEVDEAAGTVDKTSSCRVTSWLSRIWGGAVKALAARQVGEDTGDESWGDILLTVRLDEGEEVLQVSLRLLAQLSVFMTGRPRDSGTGLLLRAKAAQYSKQLDLPHTYLAYVLADTVAMAFRRSAAEKRMARTMLGGTWDAALGSQPVSRHPGARALVAWSELARSGTMVPGETQWERVKRVGRDAWQRLPTSVGGPWSLLAERAFTDGPRLASYVSRELPVTLPKA
jgi:hypothetical protein